MGLKNMQPVSRRKLLPPALTSSADAKKRYRRILHYHLRLLLRLFALSSSLSLPFHTSSSSPLSSSASSSSSMPSSSLTALRPRLPPRDLEARLGRYSSSSSELSASLARFREVLLLPALPPRALELFFLVAPSESLSSALDSFGDCLLFRATLPPPLALDVSSLSLPSFPLLCEEFPFLLLLPSPPPPLPYPPDLGKKTPKSPTAKATAALCQGVSAVLKIQQSTTIRKASSWSNALSGYM
mmetsp:Transcript_8662/g.21081  ORF Transcript_8662/g.21081 Transcript_8662/m.21081 type:complete len:242 (+) Transcript_8662:77-802(+)